jgi:hypothetical protein
VQTAASSHESHNSGVCDFDAGSKVQMQESVRNEIGQGVERNVRDLGVVERKRFQTGQTTSERVDASVAYAGVAETHDLQLATSLWSSKVSQPSVCQAGDTVERNHFELLA